MANSLTCTEKYVLLLLNIKGNVNYICGDKKFTCFIISEVLELVDKDVISIQDTRVKVKNPIKEEDKYLLTLYQEISKFDCIKIQHLVERYTTSITRRKHREIINNILEGLISKGYVKENTRGIIKKSKTYMVNKEIVEKIKIDLLNVFDNVCLDCLLLESGDISKYLNKQEINCIKEQIKDFDKEDTFVLIRQVWRQIFKSDIISLGLSSI